MWLISTPPGGGVGAIQGVHKRTSTYLLSCICLVVDEVVKNSVKRVGGLKRLERPMG